MSKWTEGVCGDGAAILRHGEMVPVEDVVGHLDDLEAILGEWRDWYRTAFGVGYSEASLAGRTDQILSIGD